MTYDLIIIGGGPAGALASVYASRKKINTLLVTSEWGGQSSVSEKIYNWIGTPEISGMELANNLKKHVLANVSPQGTLSIKENSFVTKISLVSKDTEGKNIFEVEINQSEKILTKTILICSGSKRRKLEAKNAQHLEHKGLTYCASCDGPLFSDMDVAVVGGGNAGFDSAAQLLAYCNSVTLLNRGEKFRADEITVEKVSADPKMKIIKNTQILEILGEKFVSGLVYEDKNTGKKETLNVSGIFVEIGQIPNTEFASQVVPLDEFGKVKINPLNQKTETEGIWGAGDCTNILYHQNNIASGDAVRALEDIYLYLKTK